MSAGSASAQVVISPAAPLLGLAQPVTAVPLVDRPHSTPCIVPLFTNQDFADFNDKPFVFTPPSDCPGPWRKVVFTADFTVTAGRQFDRTAQFSVGGSIIYFGTTAEPHSDLSPSWHVERNVTDFSTVFNTATSGNASLGNFVGIDSGITYDGIIYANAALEFYPASFAEPAPRVPDVVISLPGTGDSYSLETTDSQLVQTVTLPANIEKVYLDVISQSQSNDEFWWTCVPDDVSNELQSCGSTAFRETQVTLDSIPAGIAPIYPWIYTGGVSPSLWTPIPGLQTFNFEPYRVNLTPFAATLSDGQPHTVGISVFNATHRFQESANLFLYTDPFAAQVTGALVTNTLTSPPQPTVSENLTTADNGDISGSVDVGSSRQYSISGYAITSHGRVDTSIEAAVGFQSSQQFLVQSAFYSQHIAQATDVRLQTTTSSGWVSELVDQQISYPFSFVYDYADANNFTISSFQKLLTTEVKSREGRTVSTSSSADEVSSQVGNPGRQSSETYTSKDSLGGCYGRTVTSSLGLLTNLQDGVDCDADASARRKSIEKR